MMSDDDDIFYKVICLCPVLTYHLSEDALPY